MKNEKSKTTRKQALSGRAAAYIRVSTADQGERFSLPSQLKALHGLASRNGKTIPPEWIFQDSHTGKLADRPSFDKLKALVRTGVPDAVYIYDHSRFARRTLDWLFLAAEFKRHGVQLDFCEMPYVDTAAGRLASTQMAAVAEFLGEKIIEDSTRGAIEKLQGGKLDHGMAPDGYVVTKESTLAVNPDRAKIWQDVFRWRATEHLAKYAICHRLNRAGIPSARGGQWAPRVIGQNLRNRTYIGEHVRRGITVPCPAIIDRKTFDEAQRWNEEARSKQTGRPPNRYLLTGFLWCAKCGRRYRTNPQSVGGGKRPRAAYKCGNCDYHPYKQLCHAPQVLAKIIEPAAWSEIWGTLTNPDLLMQLAEDYVENNRKPESSDIAGLERERAKINAQIREAQRMIHGLLISFEAGQKMIRADKERLGEIERQLAAAGSKVIALPTRQQVEAFCRELAAIPEPGADCADDPWQAYDERRPVLEGIVNLTMKYFDHDLEISGEIPLRFAQSSGSEAGGACQNSDRDLGSYPNSGDSAVACIPFIRKVRVA